MRENTKMAGFNDFHLGFTIYITQYHSGTIEICNSYLNRYYFSKKFTLGGLNNIMESGPLNCLLP